MSREPNIPRVERLIHVVRGQKVLLDEDLARLYGVGTKVLNQAVKRNAERFPADFMFQLNVDEARDLRSRFVTSSSADSHGGRRYRPRAFTEQGVAMLSSVLRSPQAIAVNIAIMRAFVRMRAILGENVELARRLEDLERRVGARFVEHEAQFQAIFDAIRELMADDEADLPEIGFT